MVHIGTAGVHSRFLIIIMKMIIIKWQKNIQKNNLLLSKNLLKIPYQLMTLSTTYINIIRLLLIHFLGAEGNTWVRVVLNEWLPKCFSASLWGLRTSSHSHENTRLKFSSSTAACKSRWAQTWCYWLFPGSCIGLWICMCMYTHII